MGVITHKTNANDLSGDAFAISVSVTRTIKIPNSLPFHKFRQKLAKEALNCTASLQQLTALLTLFVSSGVLFYYPKIGSSQIRLRLSWI